MNVNVFHEKSQNPACEWGQALELMPEMLEAMNNKEGLLTTAEMKVQDFCKNREDQRFSALSPLIYNI